MAGLARHIDLEEIIENLRLGDDKAHPRRLRVKSNDASCSLIPSQDLQDISTGGRAKMCSDSPRYNAADSISKLSMP